MGFAKFSKNPYNVHQEGHKTIKTPDTTIIIWGFEGFCEPHMVVGPI
jgi:hypothetical protein